MSLIVCLNAAVPARGAMAAARATALALRAGAFARLLRAGLLAIRVRKGYLSRQNDTGYHTSYHQPNPSTFAWNSHRPWPPSHNSQSAASGASIRAMTSRWHCARSPRTSDCCWRMRWSRRSSRFRAATRSRCVPWRRASRCASTAGRSAAPGRRLRAVLTFIPTTLRPSWPASRSTASFQRVLQHLHRCAPRPRSFAAIAASDGRVGDAQRDLDSADRRLRQSHGRTPRAARERALRCARRRHSRLHAPFGCSQLGDDLERTRGLLAALARHPNAGGVLMLGLGCESNQLDA